jgi:hypothetical protein
MSTKTRKCPARIIMFKGNPPKFVMGQCRHEHMELTRGKFIRKLKRNCNQLTTISFAGNYKSQMPSLALEEVKPDYFISAPR